MPASPTTAATSGGILVDTESGGHVELVTADRAHASLAQVPAALLHRRGGSTTRTATRSTWASCTRCMYENEESLLGQIGYGPGALMNSDQHAMTWCRNFDGGTLVHHGARPQLAVRDRATGSASMILNAIQWTSGQKYANCVTFNEVKDLLSAAAADGDVTAAGNTALSAALASADAAHRAGDDAARGRRSRRQFVAQAKRVANVGCRRWRRAARAPVQGRRARQLDERQRGRAAGPDVHATTRPGTVGGTVPATLALTLGRAGDVRRVHARAWPGTTRPRPRRR